MNAQRYRYYKDCDRILKFTDKQKYCTKKSETESDFLHLNVKLVVPAPIAFHKIEIG